MLVTLSIELPFLGCLARIWYWIIWILLSYILMIRQNNKSLFDILHVYDNDEANASHSLQFIAH